MSIKYYTHKRLNNHPPDTINYDVDIGTYFNST